MLVKAREGRACAGRCGSRRGRVSFTSFDIVAKGGGGLEQAIATAAWGSWISASSFFLPTQAGNGYLSWRNWRVPNQSQVFLNTAHSLRLFQAFWYVERGALCLASCVNVLREGVPQVLQAARGVIQCCHQLVRAK